MKRCTEKNPRKKFHSSKQSAAKPDLMCLALKTKIAMSTDNHTNCRNGSTIVRSLRTVKRVRGAPQHPGGCASLSLAGRSSESLTCLVFTSTTPPTVSDPPMCEVLGSASVDQFFQSEGKRSCLTRNGRGGLSCGSGKPGSREGTRCPPPHTHTPKLFLTESFPQNRPAPAVLSISSDVPKVLMCAHLRGGAT